MSLQVSKNMRELEEMAISYGIEYEPSGKNGRLMKEDIINPIREFFLIKRYGSLDKIPWHMQWMLTIKSPMLATRIDSLKEDKQKAIWESDDWYFEEKLNGARMLLLIRNGEYHIYSRHNSDVDFLPIEYTSRILLPDGCDIRSIKGTYMLDCELTSGAVRLNTVVEKYGVVTETQLQAVTALLSSDVSRAVTIQKNENLRLIFNIFDCLYYDGSWVVDKELLERRKYMMSGFTLLEKAGFNCVRVRSNRSNKRDFYKGLVMTGGEGVVAKNIHSLYMTDTNRKGDGWVKIKRSMSESIQDSEDVFGDTIDGWISGYETGTAGKGLENLIATVIVSIIVRRDDNTEYEHEIARISGMDMKLREDMTHYVEGIPTLNPSYYNRVAEIDGAGVSGRSKRLNHAVLIGFRYDKSKQDCVIDESFLNKMVV